MDILVLFVDAGIEFAQINVFDLSSVVTAEFWSTTVIDANMIVSILESQKSIIDSAVFSQGLLL